MLRIAVVSETRLYREGLAGPLDEQPGLVVVATASEPAQLERRGGQEPHVVVLDHAVEGGASAMKELIEGAPGLRVLVIAVREVESDVIPWAEAGAAGFVPHDASFEDLVAGIRAVAHGWGLCPPRVAALVLSRVASLATERDPMAFTGLTRRERDVALLLEEGLSNKEIAARLRIQVATVKNHVHSILEKLEVRRRGEAASVVRAGGRI